jgi:alpha-tubulin suppressor-like RCC1 family protein
VSEREAGDCINGFSSVAIEPVKAAATAVAAGTLHSLVLCRSGAVLSFGYGGEGQLGHATQKLRKLGTKAQCTQALPKLVCYRRHCYGRGGPLGTLGTLDSITARVEALLEDTDCDCIAVAAGALHSVLLTRHGEVLTFGGNSSGQLGHGDADDAFTSKVQSINSTVY